MTDFLIDLANHTESDCILDNVFTSKSTIDYISQHLTNHEVVLVLFDISLEELYRHRDNTIRHIRKNPNVKEHFADRWRKMKESVMLLKQSEYKTIVITDEYFKTNFNKECVKC